MMRLRTSGRVVASIIVIGVGVGVGGCKKEAPPQPPPLAPIVAPEPPPPPPEPRADAECAAPIATSPAAELKMGSRKASAAGSKLSFSDPDPDGQWTLGVLGPINEDSGANLLAIKRYLKFFAEEKVDAVAVTGDVGEVPDGIARALVAVAEAKVPVLVIAGNRECKTDYTKALEKASSVSPWVVNMNRYRAVEFPGATVLSLPGYHDPNYITCATGCRYYPSSVDEVVTLAKVAPGPTVLLAHGPFKGEGSQALDYASSGGNVGNPELNKALEDGKIAFGAFSNIKEAGARATDLSGAAVVKPGVWSPAIYLNPGPADTVRWEMNDKSTGTGFAAVLQIKGKEGRWKLYRAKPLTKVEMAEAKKLDPPPRADGVADEAAGADDVAPTPLTATPDAGVKPPSATGVPKTPTE